jgi:hypothetical protein
MNTLFCGRSGRAFELSERQVGRIERTALSDGELQLARHCIKVDRISLEDVKKRKKTLCVGMTKLKERLRSLSRAVL